MQCIMQHLASLCYNRPRMRRSMSKALASWHEIWEDAVDVAVAVRDDRTEAMAEIPVLGVAKRPEATPVGDSTSQADESRRVDVCWV
ncbi:hypothetical protein FRC10_006017 [Ceratobasidium sp. 414]|nr:hypothetical protein FRC10_006017 [Ceratobasidium sp. 414]